MAGGPYFVRYVKGVAELVLERSTRYATAEDVEADLDAATRACITAELERLAAAGTRVLAVGRAAVALPQPLVGANGGASTAATPQDRARPPVEAMPMDELCFLGLIALIDPPQRDVATVVESLHAAGIRVHMVTGDHPATAEAIARQVGIFSATDRPERMHERMHERAAVAAAGADGNARPASDDDDAVAAATTSTAPPPAASPPWPWRRAALAVPPPPSTHATVTSTTAVITGADLAELNDDEWDWILAHDRIVFARTTPHHKLAIVKACQARGYRVAVTGDGVNDAPALRQADIGVAMGSGSQVAQEAAAAVLLNDRFSSIPVVAVPLGRLVFENLKKVILYLLPAGSFSELIPILATVFLGMPLALSAFLMIVICVGTDLILSLALISERAEADVMHRPTRDTRTARLVDTRLVLDGYLFRGVYMTVAAFGMFFSYMRAVGGIPPGALFLAFDRWADGYYGKSADELTALLQTGQAVYFVTVVFVQFFNLLAVRTRTRSILQHSPINQNGWNPQLLWAILATLALVFLVMLVPPISSLIGTRPPPVGYWFYPIPLGLGLLLLDEARKTVARARPAGIVARWAW